MGVEPNPDRSMSNRAAALKVWRQWPRVEDVAAVAAEQLDREAVDCAVGEFVQLCGDIPDRIALEGAILAYLVAEKPK